VRPLPEPTGRSAAISISVNQVPWQSDSITVRRAPASNLKNISVESAKQLHRHHGLSGSGKNLRWPSIPSSEGQRRYVETLSAYARQFLDQMERPDVDSIDGPSPAISMKNRNTSRSPRLDCGDDYRATHYLAVVSIGGIPLRNAASRFAGRRRADRAAP